MRDNYKLPSSCEKTCWINNHCLYPLYDLKFSVMLEIKISCLNHSFLIGKNNEVVMREKEREIESEWVSEWGRDNKLKVEQVAWCWNVLWRFICLNEYIWANVWINLTSRRAIFSSLIVWRKMLWLVNNLSAA